ncbi:MAG: hypothetical protein K8L91_29950 [Anaerolineae bacterium]|nr:hypothetical protein [Anaerolineae bacterium]
MPKKTYTPKPRTYNPGEVGYRNRGRQTGLDPFDSSREYARMEGMFLQRLLTGTLRVQNPLVLLFLLTFGLMFVVLPVGIVYDSMTELTDLDFGLFCGLVSALLIGFLGLAMIISFVQNSTRPIRKWLYKKPNKRAGRRGKSKS